MLKVGYFGTWERGYPRNEQVISALRRVGADVHESHAAVWQAEHKFALGPGVLPSLIAAEARLALRRIRDRDVLLVGYPGQFDIWSAKRHGLPVAFNAMVSLYETLVEDRQRFRPGSVRAEALRHLDRRAFRGVELLVSDTAANAAYMAELADLSRVQVAHVYVGAEERFFQQCWKQPSQEKPFTATFVGKLVPLQGVQMILDAARLLPDVLFRIFGSGQQQLLLRDRPANVAHFPWIDYERIPTEYGRAGCVLGVFGPAGKADRVIPNKAFQALAVGAPLVTANTPAARELLTDNEDALLVGRSGEALADGIRRLAESPELARKIAAAGRWTFEQSASEAVLGRRWLELLESLA